jgi:nucleotide-binding universal stress UspA family protein
MTYKTLLLHVDDSKACVERTDVAIDLAQAFDAHLVGLYGVDAPLPGYIHDELGDAYVTRCKRLLRENREKAAASFQEWISRAGVAAKWQVAGVEVLDSFRKHARYADLIIVGQTDPEATTRCVTADFPELVCLSAGRPVLVVPYAGTFRNIGECVLIAWNGSREALRAVADALPFLERAKSVVAIEVNPEEQDAHEEEAPGADIVCYLARHGVKVEAAREYSSPIDVGNLLLSRTADLSADLLVMGAYGHSRLKEIMVGGVTRTILEQMTLPVLMSH